MAKYLMIVYQILTKFDKILIIYLIASRSPPGRLHPLHEINELVVKSIENIAQAAVIFYVCPLPGTHFYHFGLPFGVTFASLGPLLEHFGFFLLSKKTSRGARGATRGAKVTFS